MYLYRDHQPLSRRFGADLRFELLLTAGMDGALGASWEDENGALVATGFFTYLIGEPTPGAELDKILPRACPFCAVPKSPAWREYLKKYPFRTYTRYKMAPPARPDQERLEGFVRSLPQGLALVPIDGEIFEKGILSEQALNIPQVFGSRERYLQEGFGFAVLDGDRAACAASSYIVHRGEAEVDISTDPAYRRRGLASAACARFLLCCADRGLTPSWDAQNPESVKLAEKLGFSPAYAYEAYVLEK